MVFLFSAFALLSVLQANAHTINYVLEKAPTHNVIWFYLKLGFLHIIPEGFDHILFVIGLCLLSTNIKTIFWQATAFTVAHSITLALSMKNIIVAPSAVVEPIIALSIL
ncbi:MAG: HupE/UreJ family protein, partial [Sphingobacteriales bacterium]